MKYSPAKFKKIVKNYMAGSPASVTNPWVVPVGDSGWLNGRPGQCREGDVIVTLNDLCQQVIGNVEADM